jgi:hypothetical protein
MVSPAGLAYTVMEKYPHISKFTAKQVYKNKQYIDNGTKKINNKFIRINSIFTAKFMLFNGT